MNTKTQTVKKTISRIVIKWVRDEDCGIDWLDPCCMVLTSDNSVDVQATYEAIIKEGGCTKEQARKQTAATIARVNAWKNDDWTYVGCVATAMATVHDAETGEELEEEEITCSSLWGIESFSGEDFQKEIEEDQLLELRCQLHMTGWGLSDAEWDALEMEQGKDSWEPTDDDAGENVRPLPELPEYEEDFLYRYATEGEEEDIHDEEFQEGEIVCQCIVCDACMSPSQKENREYHEDYCELFEEDTEE